MGVDNSMMRIENTVRKNNTTSKNLKSKMKWLLAECQSGHESKMDILLLSMLLSTVFDAHFHQKITGGNCCCGNCCSLVCVSLLVVCCSCA